MEALIIAELVSLGKKVIVKLIKLGWNAGKELRELEQNVEMIESYLRSADQTKQSVEVVEQWLQKLRGVAEQARHQLDELEKITDLISKWDCEGAIPAARSAVLRLTIGYKVDKVNQKLRKILDMGTDLGLQSRVNLASSSSSSSSSSSVKKKPHFFTKIPRWLWRKMKKFLNHLRRSDYSCDYKKMNMEF